MASVEFDELSLAPFVGYPPAGEQGGAGEPQPDARTRMPVPPRRGWPRPWGGRATMTAAAPVHRGSTAQVQGLYPWLYGGGLPAAGAYLGIDCLTGGAFSCHPLAWLAAGVTGNPNMVVTGEPGTGKSATVKALALRLMPYGIRAFILGDLKNEYAALARALGTEPVELGPGLPGRLNPLDAGPLGDNLPSDAVQLTGRPAEIHRRRLVLLCSLAVARLGRALTPTEESEMSLAIEEASGGLTSRPEGAGLARRRSGEHAVRPAPRSPRCGPHSATRPPAWPGSCGSAATRPISCGR